MRACSQSGGPAAPDEALVVDVAGGLNGSDVIKQADGILVDFVATVALLRCCAVFGDQYHRTTVLSNGFSWQGMRPTREGLPLLQLSHTRRRQGRRRREGRAGRLST